MRAVITATSDGVLKCMTCDSYTCQHCQQAFAQIDMAQEWTECAPWIGMLRLRSHTEPSDTQAVDAAERHEPPSTQKIPVLAEKLPQVAIDRSHGLLGKQSINAPFPPSAVQL